MIERAIMNAIICLIRHREMAAARELTRHLQRLLPTDQEQIAIHRGDMTHPLLMREQPQLTDSEKSAN